MESREYDIILLGATGYTGKLTAEYITQHVRTDLKWAIAGRSASKLGDVNKTLKTLNSARNTPDIITVDLTERELSALVKRTWVILNTVGPYFKYSTPVVRACAENGTHYLDVTGETPWVREIIKDYQETAKKQGAILMPEVGLESAPSDVIAYVATKKVRDIWDCGTSDVVCSIHEFKSSGASGGTLATVLGIMDHYPLRYLRSTISNPFCLSPLKERDHRLSKYPKPTSYRRGIFSRLTGVWTHRELGLLTTSITGSANNAIVLRSAGLNPNLYGYNFTYEEYMRPSNRIVGTLIHLVLNIFTVLLVIPPFRKLAKARVVQPGGGPSKESGSKDRIEMRCVAVAEQISKTPRKAYATLQFNGSMYAMTAVTLAEAGLTLLSQQDVLLKKFGAGFLTSACLGDPYVEALEKAGVKIHTEQIGETGNR